MALNAKKIPFTGKSSTAQQDALDAGTYPARLCQVICLGLQPQRPYKGEAKAPAIMLQLVYELSDEFCTDEDGEVDESKPRFIFETVPFHNLEQDKAKSTKRYLSMDPKLVHDGDWEQLLGTPVMVTLTQSECGKYNNVASTSVMRDKQAASLPEMVNEPLAFGGTDSDDTETFEKLNRRAKQLIQDALDFKGSVLEVALKSAPKKVPEVEEEPKAEKVKPTKPKRVEPAVEEDEEGEEW